LIVTHGTVNAEPVNHVRRLQRGLDLDARARGPASARSARIEG
jgi:hypothetical protein